MSDLAHKLEVMVDKHYASSMAAVARAKILRDALIALAGNPDPSVAAIAQGALLTEASAMLAASRQAS